MLAAEAAKAVRHPHMIIVRLKGVPSRTNAEKNVGRYLFYGGLTDRPSHGKEWRIKFSSPPARKLRECRKGARDYDDSIGIRVTYKGTPVLDKRRASSQHIRNKGVPMRLLSGERNKKFAPFYGTRIKLRTSAHYLRVFW
jgi:hypothetical protein